MMDLYGSYNRVCNKNGKIRNKEIFGIRDSYSYQEQPDTKNKKFNFFFL
jgi:hypothetical protein